MQSSICSVIPKHRLWLFLAAATALFSANIQAAEPGLWDGWYLSGGIGWDYANSVDLDSGDARIDFDRGVFQFTGALGKRLNERWRTEIEYSVHENSPEILFGRNPELEIDPDRGDLLSAESVLVNIVRDFQIGRAFKPYLGVGAGVSEVELVFSDMPVDGLFLQRPRREIIDDSDTTFALQAFAGFTVPVTKHFDLAADYRYLHVPDVSIAEVDGSPLKFDHGEQSVWLHLRYHPGRAGSRGSRAAKPASASQGFFVMGQAGGGFAEDLGREDFPTIDAFDPGPVALAGLGYDWRRLRTELELGYRRSVVEVVELGPDIGEDAASGDMQLGTLIASVAYRLRPEASIRPFIGVGIGLIRAEFDVEGFGFCSNFICREERQETFVQGSETVGVAQIKAGVDVALTEALHFTADYRYFVSGDIDLPRPDGSRFEGNIKYTSVVAGLRYFFN